MARALLRTATSRKGAEKFPTRTREQADNPQGDTDKERHFNVQLCDFKGGVTRWVVSRPLRRLSENSL